MGLYLYPPHNAVVLCVDKQPPIQALDRAQGWLWPPNSGSLTRFSHHYQRHGTMILFAALNVARGKAQAGHFGGRRRRESLDFICEVEPACAGQDAHVELDNVSTHKPKDDRWLCRHPNIHFHFPPTYAAWLNHVEC